MACNMLPSPREVTFSVFDCKSRSPFFKEDTLSSTLSTRRGFTAKFASLAAGTSFASLFTSSAPVSAQAPSGVQKLNYEGKPAGTGFITPLIIHNGVIYIAGQGAHSHDSSEFPMDIETHTKHVMENVKTLVERGGGTLDSILQLTVYLADIDFYEGMNGVFKTYFPNGGPARA